MQGDPQSVFDALLQTLVSITDSEFGFLDEVLYDSDGTPYKMSLSISDISWDSDSRALYKQLRARNLEFRNLDNLSGLPAKLQEVVITNNVPHDPRAGGVPARHPPIHSYMGLPVRAGGEVVGVIGVANRLGGYDEDMARFLDPYLTTCSGIIQSIRLRARERDALAALEKQQRIQQAVIYKAHTHLVYLDTDFNFVAVNAAYASTCQRKTEVLKHNIQKHNKLL